MTTTPTVPFGERVRDLRGERLSQTDLAERSELAPAALSRILSGERTPRMEHLLAIASALDVTVAELTAGTDAAASLTAWVTRETYEEAEGRRIEAEKALAARSAAGHAMEAENRALKAEMGRMQANLGALHQTIAEMRAAAFGERAARDAAVQAAAASDARAHRLEWALAQAQRHAAALQADLERSGKAQVATGVIAAALGALVAAGSTDSGPRRRRS